MFRTNRAFRNEESKSNKREEFLLWHTISQILECHYHRLLMKSLLMKAKPSCSSHPTPQGVPWMQCTKKLIQLTVDFTAVCSYLTLALHKLHVVSKYLRQYDKNFIYYKASKHFPPSPQWLFVNNLKFPTTAAGNVREGKVPLQNPQKFFQLI